MMVEPRASPASWMPVPGDNEFTWEESVGEEDII
jgi:hypothetical protein